MKDLEFKGTKGEWRIQGDCILAGATGMNATIICEMDNAVVKKPITQTEITELANAKLIASAPELLEALQELIAYEQTLDLHLAPDSGLFNKVMGAINKALNG
jgi:hypothetical protein